MTVGANGPVSWVKNCWFGRSRSDDDTLFSFDDDGRAIVRLDGYVIMTREEFEERVRTGDSSLLGPPNDIQAELDALDSAERSAMKGKPL